MDDPHTSFDLTDDRFRTLGHQTVELMLRAVAAERKDPVIRPVSGARSRALFEEPLPEEGTDLEEVFRIWEERLLPLCRRNGHPRFFGYVCTSADPAGMLADAMASALNQPVTAWRSSPGATEMERLAIRWLDDFVGFGGDGHGLLVSGGSSANLHGLACAIAAAETRSDLGEGHRGRLTAYLSPEGHVSLRKALRLLGIPGPQVRAVAIDAQRRMRPDVLRTMIERDSAEGFVPAVVCASAGTANTGAIDPLSALCDVRDETSTWLHIDGAYGAPAAVTDEYSWLRETFRRADSLSLDPHKWLFTPVDTGCVLVREDSALTRAFADYSEYTAVSQTDEIERFAFFDRGVEMSRRFRGLKVWTILKTRGARRLAEAIERDIALRRYLDERIDAEPMLEPLGSELSVSCFRFVPEGRCELETLNRLNRAMIEEVVREGRCYLSPTTLDGVLALRACIVNFRTSHADIDVLVDDLLRIGRTLTP